MRRSTIAATLLAGLALAMEIGTVILIARTIAAGHPVPLYTYAVGGFVSGAAFPIVGWIIASRRPGNAIGWIYLVIGLSQALDAFNGQYSTYGLITNPGSLPFAAESAWASTWDWAPGYVLLLTLSVLLFPDGLLPSPRWRPVIWMAALGLVLIAAPTAVATWPIRGILLTDYTGPIDSQDAAVKIAGTLQLVGLVLSTIAALASVAGLSVRFRRSHGIEREQLKWFTFAGAIEILIIATTPFLLGIAPGLGPLVSIASLFLSPLLPIAAGIAILRYRLYDIDRIISRTLAYAVLTAILAAVYLVGFLGLQSVLAPFTANGGPVAVAASTLVVFALFQPIRRRIQGAVDRRFYRSRYDAQREIESFAARVRDEVEVDRLTVSLSTTLERTMQPESASIWLRSGAGGAIAGGGRR
ncbi:MAG TPA: hypothetical protein VIM30_05735 [Candidatus Limnocylindrales bacterium]|jgi:hypothetical protein